MELVENEETEVLSGADDSVLLVPGEDQLHHDEVGEEDVGRVFLDSGAGAGRSSWPVYRSKETGCFPRDNRRLRNFPASAHLAVGEGFIG